MNFRPKLSEKNKSCLSALHLKFDGNLFSYLTLSIKKFNSLKHFCLICSLKMELEFEIILNEEFFEEFGKLLHYDIKVLLKANHNDWFTHIVAHPYAYPNHNRQMSTSIFVSTKRDKILSSFHHEY
jgi:hypothetical protein